MTPIPSRFRELSSEDERMLLNYQPLVPEL
jgi:hypothetical protein